MAMIVALAACAAPTTSTRVADPVEQSRVGRYQRERREKKRARRFEPPSPTAKATPWQIGQWVSYRRTHDGRVTWEHLELVGRDGCGHWFELTVREREHDWAWQFCVSAPPAPNDTRLHELLWSVIERRDGRVVFAGDFRRGASGRWSYAWLVSLVRASWAAGDEVPHEDVATPAGHFEGASKRSSTTGNVETTRWSHPAVLLGGVVRQVSGTDERILLDQGVASRPTPIVDGALGEERVREEHERSAMWFGVQLGFDALGTTRDPSSTTGVSVANGLGITAALDAVVHVGAVGDAPSPADPALAEELFMSLVGVRWAPLGRARVPRRFGFAPSGFYIEADLGYASLGRGGMHEESSTVGRGIAAGARLGLVALQGHDWTIGLEAHDHLALLDADEGLRHSFGLHAFVQFFVPVRAR